MKRYWKKTELTIKENESVLEAANLNWDKVTTLPITACANQFIR